MTQQGVTPSSIAGQGAGAVIAEALVRRLGVSIVVERIEPPAWLTGAAALPEAASLGRVASDLALVPAEGYAAV